MHGAKKKKTQNSSLSSKQQTFLFRKSWFQISVIVAVLYNCSAISDAVGRPIEIDTVIYLLDVLDFTSVFLSVPLDVGSEIINTVLC